MKFKVVAKAFSEFIDMSADGILDEFETINQNNFSLDDYIKYSRKGKKERMNRKKRKALYAIYVNVDALYLHIKKEVDRSYEVSEAGSIAYDNICIERDGCI